MAQAVLTIEELEERLAADECVNCDARRDARDALDLAKRYRAELEAERRARAGGTPDFLDQALNEGDGVYRP